MFTIHTAHFAKAQPVCSVSQLINEDTVLYKYPNFMTFCVILWVQYHADKETQTSTHVSHSDTYNQLFI